MALPIRSLAAMGLLLLAGPLLSACATLSEAECRVGDWYSIGQADGYNGRPAARLADHAAACGDYGIAPDQAAYAAGREDGLRQYCQPARGYREGLAGNGYAGVCPLGQERGFLSGFEAGREVAEVAARAHRLEERIDLLERALAENAAGREAALDALEAGGGSDARDVLRRLEFQERDIRDDIDDLEDDLFHLRRVEDRLRLDYGRRFGTLR